MIEPDLDAFKRVFGFDLLVVKVNDSGKPIMEDWKWELMLKWAGDAKFLGLARQIKTCCSNERHNLELFYIDDIRPDSEDTDAISYLYFYSRDYSEKSRMGVSANV